MDKLTQAFAGMASNRQFVVAEIRASKDKDGNQTLKANGNLRWDKVPMDADGKELSWSNSDNLLTHADAVTRLHQLQNKFPNRRWGIGYIFTVDDGYVFIDLDDCVDIINGVKQWKPIVQEMFNRFPHAAKEISSSGDGWHFIIKSTLPVAPKLVSCKNKAHTIEVYAGKKFMMGGFPQEGGDCDTDYTTAHQQLIENYELKKVVSANSMAGLATWSDACAQLTGNGLSKEQVLKVLFSMKPEYELDTITNSLKRIPNKYERIYGGDITGYPSMSEADHAIVGEILWVSGNNIVLCEEIWLESGLSRPKLDRVDLVHEGILKLARTRTKPEDFYNANYGKTQGAQNSTENTGSQSLAPLAIQKEQYRELMQNGRPANSVTNLKQLLAYYGITVRWNDMSHVREVSIPNTTVHIGDAENASLCKIIDLCSYNNLPVTRIDEQLNVIAQEDTYHPIAECVANKPWDGTPRLDQFIQSLKTTNDTAAYPLIRTWMIATIAAAFSERGFTQQGILVLEGPQGLQKTRWVKALDPTQANAVKEAMLLDLTNKDCIITAISHWIVEIGELDGTMRRTDIARIKGFSTSQVDVVRFPYARKNTRVYRRTSFIASVNEPRFLTDTTGNRRWWVISIVSINLNHGLDMQQVWAEAYQLWLDGGKTYLDEQQIKELNEANTKYEMVDPLEESLLSYFDWSDGWVNKPRQELTSTQVLKLLGYVQGTGKQDPTRMANILRRHTQSSGRRRHYWLPTERVV